MFGIELHFYNILSPFLSPKMVQAPQYIKTLSPHPRSPSSILTIIVQSYAVSVFHRETNCLLTHPPATISNGKLINPSLSRNTSRTKSFVCGKKTLTDKRRCLKNRLNGDKIDIKIFVQCSSSNEAKNKIKCKLN